MGQRIRDFDWAQHPLGPPAGWPEALRLAISLCLNSSFPTAIYWGPDLVLLYNDAWSGIPADKHPWALGRPASDVWPDIWDIVGPQMRQVLATGEGYAVYEAMLPMVRAGETRETWWNYSLTALRHADGRVGGIFNQGNEITEVVRARRERQAELERWRELFRQAPAPVAWLRGPQHVFEFANQAYGALVGGRDVTGLPVAQALPEVVDQGFVKLLDQVYETGEPYLGQGTKVRLQRTPGEPPDDSVVDFIYQPVRNAAGEVDGIFVLVLDMTDRARAESALRLSNWQLGEERARLAALVEAEQRARTALRKFSDTLEAEVSRRTRAVTEALTRQQAVADRLRATFDTPLLYQGYLDRQGVLLDANPTSLAGIKAQLADVKGRPFWETPWFTATPGLPEQVRAAVEEAAQGKVVRTMLEANLPGGRRRFEFMLRPAFSDRGEMVGLVPEAVDVTESGWV
jgi:PAS domain-containing protein